MICDVLIARFPPSNPGSSGGNDDIVTVERLAGPFFRISNLLGEPRLFDDDLANVDGLALGMRDVAIALAGKERVKLFWFVWRIRGSFLALSWATAGGNAGGDSIIVLKWNVLWRSTK
ncbi:MAG TPA: hypothetical protein VND64_08525, partial [Pirellulales bacterium]|nr:hypothetical protein [Pirellulales bacterium]